MSLKPSAEEIKEVKDDLFSADEDAETNDDLFTADEDSEGETNDDILSDDADTETETKEKPSGEKVKIKYLGAEEEIDLSDKDTLIPLLQKGRDYDKKLAEIEALKNSEEMAFIRNMAKEAGVADTKEFIKKVQTDLRNERIKTRVTELMDEGMGEEHARHTAELELKVAEVKPQTEVATEDDGKGDVKAFVELFTEYPETAQFKTLEDFPEDVREAIKAGKNPVVAYQQHLLKETKAKIEEAKNLESAKQRDLGSLRSAKSDAVKNPFLEGLDT